MIGLKSVEGSNIQLIGLTIPIPMNENDINHKQLNEELSILLMGANYILAQIGKRLEVMIVDLEPQPQIHIPIEPSSN